MSNLDNLNKITLKDVEDKDNMLMGIENSYANVLGKEYSNAEKILAGILLAWYVKQEKHTQAYSLGKVDKVMSELTPVIRDLANKEKSMLNQSLRASYKATRVSDSEDLGVKYSSVDGKQITSTVRAPWSGLDFTDRINRRYQYYTSTIKETITNGINHGWDAAKMKEELHGKMMRSYNEGLRLNRTEINYVSNQATLHLYDDLGVKYYEYVAVIDKRTSDVCLEMDGKVFEVKDSEVGVNTPPLHPNCRSTTIPRLKK